MQTSRRNTFLLAFAAFVVVFVLWQFPANTAIGTLMYPIRLMVTFVHETGHGLTAVLTGGRFENFVVYPNGEGIATTRGGSRFLIPQMGYLGAALFGALLLYLTNSLSNTKRLAAGLGIFFMVCALLYTGGGTIALVGTIIIVAVWLLAFQLTQWRNRLRILAVIVAIVTLILLSQNLALMIGLAAGTILLALSAYASHEVLVFVLNVLAFLIGADAFNDIRYLLDNTGAAIGNVPNDAAAMSLSTGVPTVFWVILWIVLAAAMLAFAGWMAFKRRV